MSNLRLGKYLEKVKQMKLPALQGVGNYEKALEKREHFVAEVLRYKETCRSFEAIDTYVKLDKIDLEIILEYGLKAYTDMKYWVDMEISYIDLLEQFYNEYLKRKYSNSIKLGNLKGTEKQVKWAESIQLGYISHVLNLIDREKTGVAKYDLGQYSNQQLQQVLQFSVENFLESSYWIDRRYMYYYPMFLDFLDRFEESRRYLRIEPKEKFVRK